MAHKVNLDALIAREDFEVTSDEDSFAPVFCLPELEARKNTFNILRKPIFQRATSDWTPQQVVALVKNFVDRDLIPAVIMWNSTSRLQFVMDGAHRLSALIAWVNDDYGNGLISQKIIGQENIPAWQKTAHNATKDLMKVEVGEYAALLKISGEEGVGTPEERRRAMGMNSLPVEVQRYSKPDRRKAEASFYRINQGGTPLDAEEREIIRTRRWPESIASRTLWRAGVKNKYSIGFDDDITAKIERTALEVHELLLKPELNVKASPLVLPVIGSVASNAGMGVVDQFVHLANDLPERQRQKNNFEPLLDADPKADTTGERTLEYLNKAKRLAETIASKEPYSLGMHPAVYAYSKTGKFLPGAFFAEVLLIKDLLARDGMYQFTEHRKAFEDFIVDHKYHLTLLTHDGGSQMKSARPIAGYWKTVLEAISNGQDPMEVLASNVQYANLVSTIEPPPKQVSGKISKTASIALKLRESLQAAAAVPCPECGARIYNNACQQGHDTPAGASGSGHSDNLNSEHPYCNSGHKTKREHLARLADQSAEE